MTTFEKLQDKQISEASVMSRRVGKNNWQDRRNSFAYYITGVPTFQTGTIARDVISFLNKRKNSVILQSVVRDIMARRAKSGHPYKNYDSARRSIGRVVAQLVNWNYITSGTNDDGLVTFQINRQNPAKMPKSR